MGRCEYCKKKTTEKGVTFHRFPKKKHEWKKWVQNMGRADWVPPQHSVLCSDHFDSDCLDRYWNMSRLRKGSLPTIFTQKNSHAETPEPVNIAIKDNVEAKQIPHEKLRNDIPPPVVSTVHEPIIKSCHDQGFISVGDILCAISPEPLPQSDAVTTPKSSEYCDQVSPSTARRRELFLHDHYYETSPRTNHKQLISLRQKYEVSKKKIKALKRQVTSLKNTVHSLKKRMSTQEQKKFVLESVSSALS